MFVGKVHQPGPNGLPMGWQFGDAWFGRLTVALAPAPTNGERGQASRLRHKPMPFSGMFRSSSRQR